MRMMMLVVVHSSCMLHIREMSQCILKNRSGSERKASRRIDRPLVRELVAAASRSELVVLTNQQSLGWRVTLKWDLSFSCTRVAHPRGSFEPEWEREREQNTFTHSPGGAIQVSSTFSTSLTPKRLGKNIYYLPSSRHWDNLNLLADSTAATSCNCTCSTSSTSHTVLTQFLCISASGKWQVTQVSIVVVFLQ